MCASPEQIFAYSIEDLAKRDEVAAIDLVLDFFTHTKSIGHVDKILSYINIYALPRSVIAALLTATASYKDKLLNRPEFYNKCKRHLTLQDGEERTNRLLVGL